MSTSVQGQPDDPSLRVVISPDPPADEEDGGLTGNPIDFFDNYSWRMFVALNWPAEPGKRGVPDRTKEFRSDAASPRVWETWKSAEEVFYVPGGQTHVAPTEWTSFEGPSLCPSIAPAESGKTKMLFAMNKLGTALEDLNQVDEFGQHIGPLIAQNRTYVRYEIRMNQRQYDFIRNGKLFSRNMLPHGDVPSLVYPDGSIEIKAAWREFNDSDPEVVRARYFRQTAQAFDLRSGECKTQEFGLVGFHVAQKTASRRQWIWSTFEHVDNTPSVPSPAIDRKFSFNDPSGAQAGFIDPPDPISRKNPPKDNPTPVQVFRRFRPAPPMATIETNKKWHNDPQVRGTVWENYELMFTQWPTQKFTDTGLGDPFPPNNVYNTTMETYVQNDTCIKCHFEAIDRKGDFVWFLGIRAQAESTKSSVKAAVTGISSQ
jgi:hypothetical protein